MTTVAFEFVPATKQGTKARVALEGPSGAGKTFTALLLATKLGERIGVIDTEHGSASKYASEFTFKTVNLPPPFTPERYIQAIGAAERAGMDVLVIDSLSHEWDGEGGILQMVDVMANETHNKWQAWAIFTPRHKALIERILRANLHVIVTMRSKMDTDLQTNPETNRREVVKLGMKAVQREGFEYEYDVVAELDIQHNFKVTKTRCRTLDKYREPTPDMAEVAHRLKVWLEDAQPLVIPTAPIPAARGETSASVGAVSGTPKPVTPSAAGATPPPGMVWSPSHQSYVPIPEEPAPAPTGTPLTEGQLKMLDEGFNVAKDKAAAKRDVTTFLHELGYASWTMFSEHGHAHYADVLRRVQTHDRAK